MITLAIFLEAFPEPQAQGGRFQLEQGRLIEPRRKRAEFTEPKVVRRCRAKYWSAGSYKDEEFSENGMGIHLNLG